MTAAAPKHQPLGTEAQTPALAQKTAKGKHMRSRTVRSQQTGPAMDPVHRQAIKKMHTNATQQQSLELAGGWRHTATGRAQEV